MPNAIEPPNSVVLLVSREELTAAAIIRGPYRSATADCVSVGVPSVDDGATTVERGPAPQVPGSSSLGEFRLETDGQVSIRDVHNREYEVLPVEPGRCVVTVWGNHLVEPDVVAFDVRLAVN